MPTLHITDHGRSRMRQRGLPAQDLNLLLQVGIDVPDGILVTRKGCDEVICRLKQVIGRLERLQGKRVVVCGDALVTTYHCTDAQRRFLVRVKKRGAGF